MGKFLQLIVLIGSLWAVDAIAFGGTNSTAVWQEANDLGQTVQYKIRDWFKAIDL